MSKRSESMYDSDSSVEARAARKRATEKPAAKPETAVPADPPPEEEAAETENLGAPKPAAPA